MTPPCWPVPKLLKTSILPTESENPTLKIVALDTEKSNPGDLSWAGFEALGELVAYDDTPKDQIIPRMQGAGAVLSNKTVITGEAIRACPGLRYIGLLSTGYNVVDLEAASAAGIAVTNVPGYATEAVVQHTFALLLEICNQVGPLSRSVQGGDWPKRGWTYWDKSLTELSGKTFGAVGFGSIGRQAGRLARAFGMQVLAAGSRPTEEGRSIAEYTTLEDLLARSDVVSLHCPLTPETKDLINAKTLAQMKPGAILLNTARGGLVVDADLAAALNSGHLAAAGLDVVSREPMRDDNPLRTAKNCTITPHTAWVAHETRRRLLDIAAGNLRAFLDGAPRNVVNTL